jgi:hypothetical protein
MRILVAAAALLFLATFAPPALFSLPTPPARAQLWAEPVPLEPGRPDRRRLGPLVYLGGWSLRSDDPRFGGISAMHVEGGEVIALSDAGTVMRFAVPAWAGPAPIEVRPLAEGPGSPDSKRDRDSEAMTVHGGDVWIAFERSNSVWRYDRASGRRGASAAPEAMRAWSANSGGEAMVRLPDGRFLILSEGKRGNDGTTAAVLFDGDPAEERREAVRFGYRAPEGYRITDAALLPDGRLLFLNRRVSLLEGISARLTVAALPEIGEETLLAGEEIAYLAPPLTVDNMEALSVTRENGRTIVWIASDDNFSPIQRTLLLKFALDE